MMSDKQLQAFQAGSGFSASAYSNDIRWLLGAVTLLIAASLVIGLVYIPIESIKQNYFVDHCLYLRFDHTW